MDSIEQPPSLDGTPSEDARDVIEEVIEDVVETGDDPAATAASEPVEAVEPDFLSELAVAMRGVAGQERDRLSQRTAEDARVHIEDARARGAIEADALRQGADDDLAGVDAWAEAEVERIRREAADRRAQRRAELEAALARHETVIADEVHAIETAVAEYDATLAAFTDDLGTVSDPSEIARRATLMPARKDLERVRADARAAALARVAPPVLADDDAVDARDGSTDEPASADAPAPIGVMDPTAYDEANPEAGQPWDASDSVPDDVVEPTAPAPSSGSSGAVRLLRTVPRWSPSTSDQGPDETS